VYSGFPSNSAPPVAASTSSTVPDRAFHAWLEAGVLVAFSK
jgi:hypothetical protein